MKKSSLFGVVLGLAAFFSPSLTPSLLAAPLAPGGFVVLADEPGPVGGILLSTEFSLFSGADIQGSVTSRVYSGDGANPLGGLTFTYEIVSTLSQQDISRFSIGNFGGFSTDVSYNLAALPGVAPTVSSRSSAPGDIVRFDFAGLAPGQNSTLLVIQTDAQVYATTIASVINAGSAEVVSLAPTPVPEPAAAALIGFGLLALAGVAQRRR
jgi:hypothetical protein